jgi:predicted phosphodiesterase
MRVLVISDVHANLTALNAVLEDAGERSPSYDSVWCLGDLVGYGPDPNECVEVVRSLPELVCLIGNHDQAALGVTPLTRFNHDARAAAAWTQDVLNPDTSEFLETLPMETRVDSFTLAHGSPRQPVWEYILDPRTADANFNEFETDYCLVGHSHLPLIFQRGTDDSFALSKSVPWNQVSQLAPRMILNPGSVGQPRDMDPRAAYAILDLETKSWEARRAAYDISEVQLRMLKAGLPERQALRLVAGW